VQKVSTLHAREWLIIVLIGMILLSVSLVSYINKKRIESALVESVKFEQGSKLSFKVEPSAKSFHFV
jgi:hypothetical protein